MIDVETNYMEEHVENMIEKEIGMENGYVKIVGMIPIIKDQIVIIT